MIEWKVSALCEHLPERAIGDDVIVLITGFLVCYDCSDRLQKRRWAIPRPKRKRY